MYGYTNYDTVQQITDWFTGLISDPSNPSSFIDYYNFHFYHQGQDPNVPLTNKPAFMDVVNAIHNVALQYNHGQKPSWVTEYGWNTNCNNQPGCITVTPDQQAQYEQEILEDGRTSGGLMDHAFVYTLCDPCQQQKSIYQAGQPLPAATMEASYSAQHPTWP
jgi:exo-beta-1,3-glucanase (GH17 family)